MFIMLLYTLLVHLQNTSVIGHFTVFQNDVKILLNKTIK